jgi:hypothetical protein
MSSLRSPKLASLSANPETFEGDSNLYVRPGFWTRHCWRRFAFLGEEAIAFEKSVQKERRGKRRWLLRWSKRRERGTESSKFGANPNSILFGRGPLEKITWECFVTESCDDVRRLLQEQEARVNIVLGLKGLRGLSAVTALLVDSRVSMFCSALVEEGCWWLPVLRNGTNCLGAAALREKEFLMFSHRS